MKMHKSALVEQKKSANRFIKILFIDDEPNEFQLMEWLCQSETDVVIDLSCVANIKDACLAIKEDYFDVIFLDNKLAEYNDYRESTPVLRSAGFERAIGIVSSNIHADYLQNFKAFGADFRIGKDELDKQALGFILDQYSSKKHVTRY